MTILTDEEKKKREGAAPSSVSGNVIASQQTSIAAPAKPAAPAILAGSRPAIYDGQPATGNIYNQPPAADATPAQLPAEVVQAGIDKMRSQMATPQAPTVAQTAQAPQTPPQNTEYKPGILANTREWVNSGVPLGDFIRGSRDGSKPVQGPTATPAATPAAQPAAVSASEMQRINEENLRDSRMGQIGNAGPATAEPEYPNITPTNLSAANASMANANAIRQSMIDSQSAIDQTKGPSGGIIEDQNKKDREALFAKWDRENMVKQVANMNPRNAAAVAALLGSGDRAAAEQGQTAAVRRGQDFTRESQAANAAVANREASNRERMATSSGELQSAQSKGILSGVEKDAQITALQQKAAAGDKAALETLRALRGGRAESPFKGLHAAGGSTKDEMGNVTRQPDSIVIYNEQTGQVQQVGNGNGPAVAKPDFAAYAKAVREAPQNKGKNLSDEELKKVYSQKYGAA